MRFLFEFIHGSLDLFSEIIRVLNHLDNLLIVLLQHHPGYLGSTRIDLLNRQEESLSQHLLLLLRSCGGKPCPNTFHSDHSLNLVQTSEHFLVGVVPAVLHFLDGVDDILADFFNLERKFVDLDLHFFLTGGGKGGKGRGWDGLRDVEIVDVCLELRNLVPQLYLERGRKGESSRVVLRDYNSIMIRVEPIIRNVLIIYLEMIHDQWPDL